MLPSSFKGKCGAIKDKLKAIMEKEGNLFYDSTTHKLQLYQAVWPLIVVFPVTFTFNLISTILQPGSS